MLEYVLVTQNHLKQSHTVQVVILRTEWKFIQDKAPTHNLFCLIGYHFHIKPATRQSIDHNLLRQSDANDILYVI